MADQVRFAMSSRKAYASVVINSFLGSVFLFWTIEWLNDPTKRSLYLVLAVIVTGDAFRSVFDGVKRLIHKHELIVKKDGIIWKDSFIPWRSMSGYSVYQYRYMGINHQLGRTLFIFDHDYKLVDQAAGSLWSELKLRYIKKHKISIDLSFVVARNDSVLEAMDKYYYPDGNPPIDRT